MQFQRKCGTNSDEYWKVSRLVMIGYSKILTVRRIIRGWIHHRIYARWINPWERKPLQCYGLRGGAEIPPWERNVPYYFPKRKPLDHFCPVNSVRTSKGNMHVPLTGAHAAVRHTSSTQSDIVPRSAVLRQPKRTA